LINDRGSKKAAAAGPYILITPFFFYPSGPCMSITRRGC